MDEINVTREEIEEQFNEANAQSFEPSRMFGMTYEQGVRDALRWVLGDDEDAEPPLEIIG